MTTTGPGRRRDPEVDRRVLEAALELYGAAGWGGFNVEKVAKAAGVGKASIYLRWPTGEALLIDALNRLGAIEDVETGDVRTDLVRLAEEVMRQYMGPNGRATMRLGVEADEIPAIGERWRTIRQSQIVAARALVRRAIARGELPPDTSVTLLLDMLCGAVTMHVQATPAHLRYQLPDTAARYIRDLVDFLLRAVNAECSVSQRD
ncbi:TetR/AcrR family transcriptional regulator [Streptomyces gardneri]|jgi:AcrR family transcriptional regulator|nr:TetR/AcrR family transcriptional regulator [Streptomyces gardneri]MBF6472571.1 TetR/AcrR family transcriptional regulator [Nocardia abscessus]